MELPRKGQIYTHTHTHTSTHVYKHTYIHTHAHTHEGGERYVNLTVWERNFGSKTRYSTYDLLDYFTNVVKRK